MKHLLKRPDKNETYQQRDRRIEAIEMYYGFPRALRIGLSMNKVLRVK